MHRGGALAKLVVRGDVPSALGHGVSPVIFSPAGNGAALGGPAVAPGAVVVLVSEAFTFFLLPPPATVAMTTIRTTNAPMGPQVRALFRCCRRCCMRRS